MTVPRVARFALAAAAIAAAIAAWFAYPDYRRPGAAVPAAGEGHSNAPLSSARLARGRALYMQHCAACHGAKLEGQPDWRKRGASGRLPAPPHDDSGHTWHHPDDVLTGITKHGLVPPYAPPGYQSDMPAFGSVLSDDDIEQVLAYIRSQWSPGVTRLRDEMLQQREGGRRR
jgi:mono/diheme cytochrome c family protein